MIAWLGKGQSLLAFLKTNSQRQQVSLKDSPGHLETVAFNPDFFEAPQERFVVPTMEETLIEPPLFQLLGLVPAIVMLRP